MNLQTPYFLISREAVDNNISSFKKALLELWPNSKLAYSVKTNSLPWLLAYLNQQQLMAEVVSDEEYQLAKLCGFTDECMVFNGPIKGQSLLHEAITNNAIVNIDSKSDLECIIHFSGEIGENIGVRINIDPSMFQEKDIGYIDDGFRFGFSDMSGELSSALSILDIKNKRIGLHLHCNSITRSISVYRVLARYAATLIKKYKLDLSFIDIGGGFFGGVPGKASPSMYIGAIKEELKDVIDIEKTMLILEPGSAIIGSAVDLYTSVVDTKQTGKARIVTTDGSRIHIDPLWTKHNYLFSTEGNENNIKVDKQIICGYTCMDHDRLMIIEDEKELRTGDKIIYHRVGAYSMTFGGMFIRYYPDVYVNNYGFFEKVRKRISVKDYYNIQRNMEEAL